MTDHRFEYDESLLEDCARSGVAAQIAAIANPATTSTVDQQQPYLAPDIASSGIFDEESCVTLFELHAAHYGRQHSKEESLLQRVSVHLERDSVHSTDSQSAVAVYEMGSKMMAFVANVVRVHEHNLALYDCDTCSGGHSYRLRLNRFADHHEPGHRFLATADSATRRRRRQRVLRQKVMSDSTVTVTLSTPRRILRVARDLRYGSKHATLYNKKQSSSNVNQVVLDQYPHPIRLPDAAQEITDGDDDDPFHTPTINTGMDGTLVNIKRQKSSHSRSPNDDQMWEPPDDAQSSLLPRTDKFAVSLNWATANNPDGVALVHDPVDQVGLVFAMYQCVVVPARLPSGFAVRAL
jgi:hypothetical protein